MNVSIVIPTYKRVDYLERLLISIKNQTFQKYEIIVVDDCSPNKEEYEQLVKKYTEIFDEFTFLSNPKNSGAPHSRNRGIKKSKYDLIALVDDDDEWLPTKLEKQVNVFENNIEDVGLVYTWTDVMDEERKIIHKYRTNIEGDTTKNILQQCFVPSPSVMVRKKAIFEVGLFDEALPSCQDWDMWTRMILNGTKVKVLKEVVTIYHKHTSETIGHNKKAYKGFIIYYKKHFYSALCIRPMSALSYLYNGIKIWSTKKI